MYNHEIKIAFGEGGEVEAEPNPLAGDGGTLQPGDTVTWILPESRAMEVQFAMAQDLPVESNALEESDQNGPFKSLLSENGRIVGELSDDLPEGFRPRLFYYKLVEDGRALPWVPGKRPPGAPPDHTMGGGIELPPRPPRDPTG
jgi:hypothetical protein